MGLIDKIKAEVEKKTHGEQGYSSGDAECGYRECARDILSFLNTLETKEVELDEDVDRILEENDWNYDEIDFYEFAKHFYELGQLNERKD